MTEHKDQENSIIPISSTKLVRVEGSISITNKIIKQREERLSEINQPFYPGVVIGSQFWMTENLNVDRFRNGEVIPEAKTDDEWVKAGENEQAAWCYYNNDAANGEKYGKLYNWYAVNDPRGLAPKGWHIPSDEEWTILTDFLGGQHEAGCKMKTESGWILSGYGNNESGFSGLPSGIRKNSGDFILIGIVAHWWTNTEFDSNNSISRGLFDGLMSLTRCSKNQKKKDGLSVRCLRD